jgi:phosphopantetheine--protein transferase-like protein
MLNQTDTTLFPELNKQHIFIFISHISDLDPTKIPLFWFDEDENNALKRIGDEHHRNMYLLSHGLLRWVLSQYTQHPPQNLIFTRNQRGKPDLQTEQNCCSITFNLSHSGDWAALAVSSESAVGVDIEHEILSPAKFKAIPRIIKRYFHPNEQIFFNELDEAGQVRHFYPLWTMKEAFLKATGSGIANGLNRYLFAPFLESARWKKVLDTNQEINKENNIKPSNNIWLGITYDNISDYSLALVSSMNKANVPKPDTVKMFRLSPGCHKLKIQSI